MSAEKATFEIIGDIAVVEIRGNGNEQEYIDYIRNHHPKITTILAKEGKHDGIYRIQHYRLIWGEDKREALYKENGSRFCVDIEQVYYSTRLSTDREEVCSMPKNPERILVLFSGYAPYGITFYRLLPEHHLITCVELNSKGTEYAQKNIMLNKNIAKKTEQFEQVKVLVGEKKAIEIINYLKIQCITEDARIFCQKNLFKETIDTNEEEILLDDEKNQLQVFLLNCIEKQFVYQEKKYSTPWQKNYLYMLLQGKKIEKGYDRMILPLPHGSIEFIEDALKKAAKQVWLHIYTFIIDGEDEQVKDIIRIKIEQAGYNIQDCCIKSTGQCGPNMHRKRIDILAKEL